MMKCKARGNPGPSYKWTKGTSEEVHITRRPFSLTIFKYIQCIVSILQVGTGDTLTLVASSAVVGQYYCHATVEGFPSVTSKPAGLNIILKAEIDISSKVSKP